MKAAWYRQQGPSQEVIEVGEMPSPTLSRRSRPTAMALASAHAVTSTSTRLNRFK